MTESLTILEGTVLNNELELSYTEICTICGAKPEIIEEMITEGIINPQGTRSDEWRFNGYEIRRVQIVLRLQRDLGINMPGAALVLDLLEEIEKLRIIRKRTF